MANDLATMRASLRQQLSDVEDDTWDAGEKDDLLQWSMRRLNRRVVRPLDPRAAEQTITLVSGTEFYSIDSGITHIYAVDHVLGDTNLTEMGEVGGWEIVGDLAAGTAKIRVNEGHAKMGGTLHLNAAGRYDLTTNLIPDDYVTLVLAMARAEALRRLSSDRARFKQWQNTNQVQNISVNELLQMVQDADRQADQEWALMKQWQMPVNARLNR